MIYVGIDTAFYPGSEIMESIWDSTELTWCGFYLLPQFHWRGHYPVLRDMGWGVAPIYTGKQPGSAKLQAIRQRHEQEAKQSRRAMDAEQLKRAMYANGQLDGQEAVQQARAANLPLRTYLYFDVENTVPNRDWFDYYRGWSRAVVQENFGVGLYTRTEHAAWVSTQLLAERGFDIVMPVYWIARYTRANANGAAVPNKDFLAPPFPAPNPTDVLPGATCWQHIGNFGMRWPDGRGGWRRFSPVDFNSSIYPDPGRGFLDSRVW